MGHSRQSSVDIRSRSHSRNSSADLRYSQQLAVDHCKIMVGKQEVIVNQGVIFNEEKMVHFYLSLVCSVIEWNKSSDDIT